MNINDRPGENYLADLPMREGHLGPYRVTLSPRALNLIRSYRRDKAMAYRMMQVNDGIMQVVRALLQGDGGPMSAYFRFGCPDGTPPVPGAHGDEAQASVSLQGRFCSLLQCLKANSDTFNEWQIDMYSHMKAYLDLLCDCLRQALGAGEIAPFNDFVIRFARLWDVSNNALVDAKSVEEELETLRGLMQSAFEGVMFLFLKREALLGSGQGVKEALVDLSEKVEDSNEAIAGLSESIDNSTKLGQSTMRKLIELTVMRQDDGRAYDRMSGLERCNASQRKQLCDAMKYSHGNRYMIALNGYGKGHSLKQLGEKVWGDHKEEYELLAKLNENPGYKNVETYVSKLYKLAKRYPLAGHFAYG